MFQTEEILSKTSAKHEKLDQTYNQETKIFKNQKAQRYVKSIPTTKSFHRVKIHKHKKKKYYNIIM